MFSNHPATPDQSLMGRALMRRGINYSPDQGEGGGNAGAAAQAQTAQQQASKSDDTDTKIAAAVAAERAKWEQAAADKAKADKEKADADAAKERGEWEKVAKAETAKREAAERREQHANAALALRDHLAAKHPEYAANARYILPLIDTTLTGDKLDAAIAAAAKQYVDDNPRTPKLQGGGVTPNRLNGGGNLGSGTGGSPQKLAINPENYANSIYKGPRVAGRN